MSQRHPVWVTENHVNPCNSVWFNQLFKHLVSKYNCASNFLCTIAGLDIYFIVVLRNCLETFIEIIIYGQYLMFIKNMNKSVGVNIHIQILQTPPFEKICSDPISGRIVQSVHFVLEWEAPRGPVISVAWETGSFGWWRREGLLGPTPSCRLDQN
jgi:hypothetical protein